MALTAVVYWLAVIVGIVIFAWVLYLGVGKFFANTAHSDSDRGRSTLGKLHFFAVIARNCQSEDAEGNATSEVGGWKAERMGILLSGRVWVWRLIDSPTKDEVHQPRTKSEWIVAIRGTKSLQEWLGPNASLIGANYQAFLADVNLVKDEITHYFERQEGRRVPNFILCGHSLGAAIATTLTMLCPTATSAVIFDSPGLPDTLRDQVLATRKPILALNASPNIVNTVHRPVATYLYVCGRGVDLELHHISRLLSIDVWSMDVWSLVSPMSFASLASTLWSALSSNIETHYMPSILNHICDGKIVQTSVTTWPTYSRDLLIGARMVMQRVSDIGAYFFAEEAPRVPAWPAEQTRASPPSAQSPRALVTPPAPSPTGTERHEEANAMDEPPIKSRSAVVLYEERMAALAGIPVATDCTVMQVNTVYKIDCLENLLAFLRSLPMDAILLPIIGKTSQGKTATLLALLGLSENADLRDKLTGAGVNNTIIPLVARWQVDGLQHPVFLLDLPGIGSAASFDEIRQQGLGSWWSNYVYFDNRSATPRSPVPQSPSQPGPEAPMSPTPANVQLSFVQNTYSKLLKPLQKHIAAILVIVRDHLTMTDQDMLNELKQLKVRVVVGHNVPNSITVEGKSFLEHREPHYSILSKVWNLKDEHQEDICFTSYCGDVMRQRGVALETDFKIERLIKSLRKFLNRHGQQIVEEQNREMPWVWGAARTVVATGMAAMVTRAVWVPVTYVSVNLLASIPIVSPATVALGCTVVGCAAIATTTFSTTKSVLRGLAANGRTPQRSAPSPDLPTS